MEPTATPELGQSILRLPPIVKTLDYPVATGIALDVTFVCIMLVVSRRFDPTGGSLTIALMVVLAFIGASVAVITWTIPPDEETATILGGLATAFGAVVAYWLRGRKD